MDGWLAQVARLLEAAPDADAFRGALLEWAGRARQPAHADLFGDALALAGLMGRAEVLDEAAEDGDVALAEPTVGTVTFDEALAFFRQKVSMPSAEWTDYLRGAHDRAFVVAGATDVALVEDLRRALDTAIDGGGFDRFKAEFAEIAERHGWAHTGRPGWRARTIYDTNLRTARAAGRWAQMRDPEMLKLRPFWRYVHGSTREPIVPRAEHVALDGLVLEATDPIWETIYPPNGWGCSCGVRSVSRTGLRRLGKDGPDAAPELGDRRVRDPATDEIVRVPEGIDLGWDYAPGAGWHRGAVPRELARPLDPWQAEMPVDPLPPIDTLAKPLKAPVLADDLDDAALLDAFLSRFGASAGPEGGSVWRDPTGMALPISEDLFRTAQGELKVRKRGRAAFLAQFAESMLDPDEVWLNWGYDRNLGWRLYRYYLRWDGDGGNLLLFQWSGAGWSATTAMRTTQKSLRGRASYQERQRQGALLYRRKVEE